MRKYSFSAEGALQLLYGSLYVPLQPQLEPMSHHYFVELCVLQQDNKKKKTHVALWMRAYVHIFNVSVRVDWECGFGL